MKYGTFHYGEGPYGNYDLISVSGAIGQAQYRLSSLGTGGIAIGSKIINQIVSFPTNTNRIRVQYNNTCIVSQRISLPIHPTRIRIKTNQSGWLISEIGTLRTG